MANPSGLRKLFGSIIPPRHGTPGRNDPCWCGSGKKYKRCHLEQDELKKAGTRGIGPSRTKTKTKSNSRAEPTKGK